MRKGDAKGYVYAHSQSEEQIDRYVLVNEAHIHAQYITDLGESWTAQSQNGCSGSSLQQYQWIHQTTESGAL